MAIRINALIWTPATTGVMACEKIGWPFPLCDIGRANAGADQRVAADLVQRRKPKMAGVLAHFDRNICLDETVLKRIINHIAIRNDLNDSRASDRLPLPLGVHRCPSADYLANDVGLLYYLKGKRGAKASIIRGGPSLIARRAQFSGAASAP